jgi:hypothetical protein
MILLELSRCCTAFALRLRCVCALPSDQLVKPVLNFISSFRFVAGVVASLHAGAGISLADAAPPPVQELQLFAQLFSALRHGLLAALAWISLPICVVLSQG